MHFPRETKKLSRFWRVATLSVSGTLSSLNILILVEGRGVNLRKSAMREEHSPGRDGRRSGGLRSLIEPRFLSSFALNDGGSISGRRSSYLKLPPQARIKLSVVKLNGSLFGTILLIQFRK